jgi:hypothetical protein
LFLGSDISCFLFDAWPHEGLIIKKKLFHNHSRSNRVTVFPSVKM